MPVDGRMEMGLKGGDSVDLGGVLNLSNKNNQTAINTDEDDDDDEDDDEEDEEETTADHHQPDPDSDQEPGQNNFRNHLMKNFDWIELFIEIHLVFPIVSKFEQLCLFTQRIFHFVDRLC